MGLTIPPTAVGHIRRGLRIRGRVQGVGFRPFVYRIATELGLSGHVGNDSDGVFIEIQGTEADLNSFLARLTAELPPLASISEIQTRPLPLADETGFAIRHSQAGERQEAEITPDVATCGDCLRELLDPNDRRYRYPFINCTNCGPRYSIVRGVPYDRPLTTMARFKMCPACQAEYDDPANRRFHAQPNACPICGPRIWLTDPAGREIPGDPISNLAGQIRSGKTVAIKGIGGFHLACDATSEDAVQRLRTRKGREAKPLAVMVASLEVAQELADIDSTVAAAMLDIERPIVLVPRRQGAGLAVAVAPDTDSLGLMLPYAPLHHLLFAAGLGPLVMTSGNPSEEPLCCDNTEALARLGGIADSFLLHDRDIERRVDDSVVMTAKVWRRDPDGSAQPAFRAVPIRRARGFAPSSIMVNIAADAPVLAVGGELKSTVCILAGRRAVLSEHLGDLSNPSAYRNFAGTAERLAALLRIKPETVAHDLHPGYASTQYAQQQAAGSARFLGIKHAGRIGVQHHHAHIVSCMADNGITGRVIGLACDGTGYGTDGAIWGCELLACDEADFERLGHLEYFPLLGGDAAAHQTWRPAAGLLWQLFGARWVQATEAFRRVPADALSVAQRQLESGSRVALTSSLGRLFDAVAFLLGICDHNRYEAEAAMRLEAMARRSPEAAVPSTPLQACDTGSPLRFSVHTLLNELIDRRAAGEAPAALARFFHESVAIMLADAALASARASGLTRVVLSGGCFANRLLLERTTERLAHGGVKAFVHNRVPTGDGGIALGQAVAAAARIARSDKRAGSEITG